MFIGRRPTNSIQAIQRKMLEAKKSSQLETLESLRILSEDLKEVKALQEEVAENEKEIARLMQEVGLKA